MLEARFEDLPLVRDDADKRRVHNVVTSAPVGAALRRGELVSLRVSLVRPLVAVCDVPADAEST